MTQQQKKNFVVLAALALSVGLTIIFKNEILELIFWTAILLLMMTMFIYGIAFILEKSPKDIVAKIPFLNKILSDIETILATVKKTYSKKPEEKKIARTETHVEESGEEVESDKDTNAIAPPYSNEL